MGNNNIIKVNYAEIEKCKNLLDNKIKSINSLQQNIKYYSMSRYKNVYDEIINNNNEINRICDVLNNNCKYLSNVLKNVEDTNYRIKTYNSISIINEISSSTFNFKNLVKISGETGTIGKIASAIVGPLLKIDEEKFGKIDGVVVGGSVLIGLGKIGLNIYKEHLKKANPFKGIAKLHTYKRNIRKINIKKPFYKKVFSGSSIRYVGPKGLGIGLKYAKEDFKAGISKLKWGKTGADHLGAAFAWGGILLDGISNFKKNKEEYRRNKWKDGC